MNVSEDLKYMLYEVMLNSLESESRTDSDNEYDINQLDSEEISSQTSSDQDNCISDCQPKTINVIS